MWFFLLFWSCASFEILSIYNNSARYDATTGVTQGTTITFECGNDLDTPPDSDGGNITFYNSSNGRMQMLSVICPIQTVDLNFELLAYDAATVQTHSILSCTVNSPGQFITDVESTRALYDISKAHLFEMRQKASLLLPKIMSLPAKYNELANKGEAFYGNMSTWDNTSYLDCSNLKVNINGQLALATFKDTCYRAALTKEDLVIEEMLRNLESDDGSVGTMLDSARILGNINANLQNNIRNNTGLWNNYTKETNEQFDRFRNLMNLKINEVERMYNSSRKLMESGVQAVDMKYKSLLDEATSILAATNATVINVVERGSLTTMVETLQNITTRTKTEISELLDKVSQLMESVSQLKSIGEDINGLKHRKRIMASAFQNLLGRIKAVGQIPYVIYEGTAPWQLYNESVDSMLDHITIAYETVDNITGYINEIDIAVSCNPEAYINTYYNLGTQYVLQKWFAKRLCTIQSTLKTMNFSYGHAPNATQYANLFSNTYLDENFDNIAPRTSIPCDYVNGITSKSTYGINCTINYVTTTTNLSYSLDDLYDLLELHCNQSQYRSATTSVSISSAALGGISRFNADFGTNFSLGIDICKGNPFEPGANITLPGMVFLLLEKAIAKKKVIADEIELKVGGSIPETVSLESAPSATLDCDAIIVPGVGRYTVPKYMVRPSKTKTEIRYIMYYWNTTFGDWRVDTSFNASNALPASNPHSINEFDYKLPPYFIMLGEIECLFTQECIIPDTEDLPFPGRTGFPTTNERGRFTYDLGPNEVSGSTFPADGVGKVGYITEPYIGDANQIFDQSSPTFEMWNSDHRKSVISGKEWADFFTKSIYRGQKPSSWFKTKYANKNPAERLTKITNPNDIFRCVKVNENIEWAGFCKLLEFYQPVSVESNRIVMSPIKWKTLATINLDLKLGKQLEISQADACPTSEETFIRYTNDTSTLDYLEIVRVNATSRALSGTTLHLVVALSPGTLSNGNAACYRQWEIDVEKYKSSRISFPMGCFDLNIVISSGSTICSRLDYTRRVSFATSPTTQPDAVIKMEMDYIQDTVSTTEWLYGRLSLAIFNSIINILQSWSNTNVSLPQLEKLVTYYAIYPVTFINFTQFGMENAYDRGASLRELDNSTLQLIDSNTIYLEAVNRTKNLTDYYFSLTNRTLEDYTNIFINLTDQVADKIQQLNKTRELILAGKLYASMPQNITLLKWKKFQNIWQGFADFFVNLPSNIKNIWDKGLQALIDFINSIIDAIEDALDSVGDFLVTIGLALLGAIVVGVTLYCTIKQSQKRKEGSAQSRPIVEAIKDLMPQGLTPKGETVQQSIPLISIRPPQTSQVAKKYKIDFRHFDSL